jgi:hypothetical protein
VTAVDLTPGTIVRVRQGDYDIRITSDKRWTADSFGRQMVTFDAEIIRGPDRIGESGPVTFGSGATMEVVP